jgi:hypothetical protein
LALVGQGPGKRSAPTVEVHREGEVRPFQELELPRRQRASVRDPRLLLGVTCFDVKGASQVPPELPGAFLASYSGVPWPEQQIELPYGRAVTAADE